MQINEYRVMLVKDRTHKYESVQVTSPNIVEDILRAMGADREIQESMYVFYLNTKNKIMGVERVAKGGMDSAMIDPKSIFRGALLSGARGIIIAHNHPSGSSIESADDIRTTRKIKEGGEILGIDLLDSVIIGDGFTSLREKGII